MKYIDYRAALGIGFNDKAKEQLFINRMWVYFQKGVTSFDHIHETKFCYTIGLPIKSGSTRDLGRNVEMYRAMQYLEEVIGSFKHFLAALVAFANTYGPYSDELREKDKFVSYLKRALSDSGILFDVVEDADGIFIFPKGAKELDDKLVSEPLQWLAQFPNARNAWIKALKAYADATDNNASDCADLFRKALEQFFKEFFSSDKSLENYKSEYGALMKSRGIPAELSNMFEKVLNQYTAYMNNYAKHKDGTAKIALEYIMYQTGSLIRFLITLKQEEMNHAD